jgi:hypothetical protein
VDSHGYVLWVAAPTVVQLLTRIPGGRSDLPTAVYGLPSAVLAFAGQVAAQLRMAGEPGATGAASEVLYDVMRAEAWGYGLAGLCGVAMTALLWRVGPQVGRSVLAGFSGVLVALGLRHVGLSRGWAPGVDPDLLGSMQLAPTPLASVVAPVLVLLALATLPRTREGWRFSAVGVLGWLVLLAPLYVVGGWNTAEIPLWRSVGLSAER